MKKKNVDVQKKNKPRVIYKGFHFYCPKTHQKCVCGLGYFLFQWSFAKLKREHNANLLIFEI